MGSGGQGPDGREKELWCRPLQQARCSPNAEWEENGFVSTAAHALTALRLTLGPR